jgi:hypothetical protein
MSSKLHDAVTRSQRAEPTVSAVMQTLAAQG